jgi:hypothetical protein
MWKLTSLALAQPICWGRRFANGTIIGLLTIGSIAPNSEAMTANTQPSLQQPAANLHAQIIFRIGDRGYTRRQEGQYRRDLILQRRREAARRQQDRMRDNRNGRDNRHGQNRRDR